MPTLDFKGKQHIYAHHLTIPYRAIEVDENHSYNSNGTNDNLIIHGDNLHALKALLPRYANRIKCIYIDPPYNTGNEEWVYNDNVNSPLMQQWLAENSPVDNEDLERHDKWLCMMWPRLHLLKELLADDGVIFISIDDNEQHHLRMVMDEIFEERNFVANIVWHHRKSSQNDIDVSLSHNHILCYALDRTSFSFNAGEVDESKFANPDSDPRGPWVADPMDAPHIRENLTYEIVNPNTGRAYLPPAGRHWRFSKEKYEAALKEKRILFGKKGTSKPQYKRFLSEAQEKGVSIFTIWSDVGTATDATKELIDIFGREQFFATPKPMDLIAKIIRVSTTEDDIVLDAFAGSGTTAHAVLAMNKKDGGNRKFILIECEDYANVLTAERVRRVINGVPNASDKLLREGLEGSFTYGTLGKPFEIEGMLTGESLPAYELLATHLLYMVSGVCVEADALEMKNDDGFFHSDDRNDYYLLYQPDLEYLESSAAMLNLERAERIRDVSRQKGLKAIVYAPGKYISQRELTGMGITFCQLPHALYER